MKHDIALGWQLYSFGRRHWNFKHPADLGLGPLDPYGEPQVRSLALREQLEHGTAFLCSYYEHGNCRWWIKGDSYPAGVEFVWDGCRVAGLLVWQGGAATLQPKTYNDRHTAAAQFLEDYTLWCNGELDEDDADDFLEMIQTRDVKRINRRKKKVIQQPVRNLSEEKAK